MPRTGLVRRSLAVPVLYLCVTAVALTLPFVAKEPEAGIWFGLLTLPWSILGVVVLDAIDPALLDSRLGLALLILGALVNATLLYLILRRNETREARPAA